MLNGLLGKKKEMSQIFDAEGNIIPVTILEVGPCVVTQVKTKEKDGYEAFQLGFEHTKPKLLKKPQAGHFKNIRQKPRFLREVKVDEEQKEKPEFKVGDKIRVAHVFKVGDKVAVVGVSKGKGFAGVVKRWGFAGGPKTHGQSDRLRAPGAIGSTTTPGRVYRGKKMAGRMGGEQVTVKGLRVVDIDAKNNQLKVKGAVPGCRDGIIFIQKQSNKVRTNISEGI